MPNLVEFNIYGESTTAAYIDASSPDENPWANYRTHGQALLNPITSTGGTSICVTMYAKRTWGDSRKNLASWMARRKRRIWVMLNALDYADALEVVKYFENESGASDLVAGYGLYDEPTRDYWTTDRNGQRVYVQGEVDLVRGQIRAVREASDKPCWLNLTCVAWERDWIPFFQIGGSRHEYYPNIYTLDAYPYTFSDGSAGERFTNRLQTGAKNFAWEDNQQRGYDWYMSKLVRCYLTYPLQAGASLTPATGHVLGVIIGAQEQHGRVRSDRNESAFVTWRTLTQDKITEQLKFALAQSPWTVRVGESDSRFVPTAQIDGTQLFQWVSVYWWGGNGYPLNDETAFNTAGLSEMPLLTSSRIRGYVGYGTGLAKNWTVPGTIIFPGGASSEVAYSDIATKCATPRISKHGIFYRSSAEEVSITCDTPGASIYYTTDGSVPTTSSTLYTAPLNIAASTTIRAIGYKAALGAGATSHTATARLNFASVAPPYNLTHVRYYAVSGLEARLNGAKIQGSDNNSTWTDIHTISGTPATGYSTEVVTVSQRWRHYRLYHASAQVVVGHLQFLNSGEALSGTPITSGATAGHQAALAFDGDLATYFEASANGGWIGIDTGVIDVPPPPPPGAALSPAAAAVNAGYSQMFEILNIGTRTVASYTWEVAGIATVTVQGAASFAVKGVAQGQTDLTVTLSDATVLVASVTVSPVSPRSSRWLSVPRVT